MLKEEPNMMSQGTIETADVMMLFTSKISILLMLGRRATCTRDTVLHPRGKTRYVLRFVRTSPTQLIVH